MPSKLDPDSIRREAVSALFGSDQLYEHAALKGGSALEMAHRVGNRSSLDIDLSMEGDFSDQDSASALIERLLDERFSSLDHKLFDFKFQFRPRTKAPVSADWGGYQVEFKVIPTKEYVFGSDDKNRRAAVAYHYRKFKIDISRAEYIGDPLQIQVGNDIWRVYTRELLVVEKLRAICQQQPSYQVLRGSHRKRRPRDFYDIVAIMESDDAPDVTSESFLESLRSSFDAKKVPTELLGEIGAEEVSGFHAEDWASVINAVGAPIESFDYYFRVVASLVRRVLSELE